MDGMILDRDFNNLATVDTYQSFIWTDRYYGVGDFEIYSPPTKSLLDHAKKGNYVWFEGSEHMMVIDTVTLTTDETSGVMLKVTGESLEGLLKRRINLEKNVGKGDLQTIVRTLLEKNCLLGTVQNPSRIIPRLVFETNTDLDREEYKQEDSDMYVHLDEDDDGTQDIYLDNLYDIIYDLCFSRDVGFKISFEEHEYDGMMRECFVFRMYQGADRSDLQDKRPVVTFSPKFENLLSSEYVTSYKDYKNLCYVTYTERKEDADGNTIETEKFAEVWLEGNKPAPEGLDRWEMNTSADADDETKDKTAVYKQEGEAALKEVETTEAFDGEVDPFGQYRYGRDFWVGDIVQIVNEFDMEARSRVTEVTFSSEPTGEKIYPVFESIEE